MIRYVNSLLERKRKKTNGRLLTKDRSVWYSLSRDRSLPVRRILTSLWIAFRLTERIRLVSLEDRLMDSFRDSRIRLVSLEAADPCLCHLSPGIACLFSSLSFIPLRFQELISSSKTGSRFPFLFSGFFFHGGNLSCLCRRLSTSQTYY